MEKYRKLIYHAESDDYIEVTDEKQFIELMNEGWCDDVTDSQIHEELYLKLSLVKIACKPLESFVKRIIKEEPECRNEENI